MEPITLPLAGTTTALLVRDHRRLQKELGDSNAMVRALWMEILKRQKEESDTSKTQEATS